MQLFIILSLLKICDARQYIRAWGITIYQPLCDTDPQIYLPPS